MFPGIGTVANIATVLIGSTVGVLVGHRLPERTREVVTDGIGLVTLLIGGTSAAAVADPALVRSVGGSAPMLIVLMSILVGGILGATIGVEDRLEGLGGRLQALAARRLRDEGDHRRARFVEGFVTSSLVFCTGPLTILGSLSDGLGRGADQLLLKSVLDGFAAIAFAASFGWGVAASVVVVAVGQGGLTLIGLGLGTFLGDAYVAALGATGGVILVGLALRLLRLSRIRVADLLPALVVAPLLVAVVHSLR